VRATLSRDIHQALRASHTVGLSIALVDGNRTVWARGFGWANRAARLPVTSGTLFHIGSSSKSMAAAAVMQLVEQGRVDLDAPLSRYVPQFRLLPRFPGSVITVRSVLEWNRLVVAPAGPRLAFTFGFTSVLVQRGAGDALSSAGDTLTILGPTYRRVETGEER
jgi:hypothetical protein